MRVLWHQNSISRSSLLWGALLSLAGCAVAYAATPTPFAPPVSPAVTVFRNAVLIDGSGAPPRQAMAVIVDGQRIRAVLPDAAVTPEMLHGANVVDLTGKFLLPGLIDSHVQGRISSTPP